jgi:anaphase-promoting complex subunit 2
MEDASGCSPQEAWEKLVAFLSTSGGASISRGAKGAYHSYYAVLKQGNLDGHLITWYFDFLREKFSNVGGAFWGHFPETSSAIGDGWDAQSNVFQAVAKAYDVHLQAKVGTDLMLGMLAATVQDENHSSFMSVRAFSERCRSLASSTVFNAAPRHFQQAMFQYFKNAFLDVQAHRKLSGNAKDNSGEDSDESVEDSEEEEPEDIEIVEGRIEAFKLCASRLRELGWLGRFEEAFTEMLYVRIDSYVVQTCEEEYEDRMLSKIEHWTEENIFSWLNILFEDADAASPAGPTLQAWKARFRFHLQERFCELRISELFDVIKTFPDSKPALLDLRDTLERTHLHRKLVLSLREVLQQRLLHPGANTSQIIDVYVAAIKALRLLDPTGVLLESVSESVKDYLRGRHDTVRCIVGSLTDDTSSDLFEELGRGEAKPIEHDDSDDENFGNDSGGGAGGSGKRGEWMPDPVDADPNKTSKSRRSNDILSMLVQIYGSKELFVTEYRSILADKLLEKRDYDTDKEVRTLELLKLRFGESSMHHCEVMVKDIADSRRVNLTIKAEKEKQGVDKERTERFSSTVVSRHFWPQFKGNEIGLHGKLEEMYDEFAKDYGTLKAPRSLEWKSQLGFVELELEIGGVMREFVVSPVLATILLHFEDQKTWGIGELSELLKLSEQATRKHLSFWVGNGLVSTVGGRTFSLVEKLSEEADNADDAQAVGVEDADGAEAAKRAKQEELAQEMMVFESYIIGMLRNMGKLPLERIHNMLKMFCADPKYDKEIDSLEQFLDKMCTDEKIESDGAVFSLP